MISKEVKLQDFTENYDWLIILDSCRYDSFKKVAFPLIRRRYPNASLEARLSLGSCTLETLKNIPTLQNSVVLTGHPFVIQYRDKFSRVIDVGFDYRLNTCPPWYMWTSFLLRYRHLLEYRRRILWFLQPHHPYIAKIKANVRIFKDSVRRILATQEEVTKQLKNLDKKGLLLLAYESNLELVTYYVLRCLKRMEGIIVITSDHGEGLGRPLREGDKPIYSHPCGREELELRLVPWCVIKI